MTRDEIIARLAGKFGPHAVPVPRDAGDPERSPIDCVPDGRDDLARTWSWSQADDGSTSLRALTYGEIADALCDPS